MITRVRRLFRQRLPILVLLVVLGTGGAVFATQYSNDQIRPTYQATALVFIQSPTEESGRLPEADLTLVAAHQAAVEANADFLDIRHGIRADPSTESIEFIANAGSEEIARTDASDMRIRYLVATAPPPVEDQISETLEKAHFVREELDRLFSSGGLVEIDSADVSQFSILSEQIRSLNTESAKLGVQLVLADSESERADIQADLDLIRGQIIALQEQLEALPPEVAESASPGGADGGGAGRLDIPDLATSNLALDDQFRIESLQALYSSVLSEFQLLYISSINADPETLPDIFVTDETGDPVPLGLGAGIGLVGMLLFGLGASLVIDRLWPRWWVQHELASPIAETPDRRSGLTETWYWNTPSNRRKDALQIAAVRLLPAVEAGPAAVGLLGLEVSSYALRGLGYDLAAVMVTSGRPTLVIDTTGLEGTHEKDRSTLTGGLSVGDLLNPWQNGNNQERARQAVEQAIVLWPGLATIPAGSPTLYSVEGALTPVIGTLIDDARRVYDLTLVPIVDRGTALTDAFVRKLDALIVVGHGGRTRLRAAEAVLEELTGAGKPVLGTLLLVRPTRRRLRELVRNRSRQPQVAIPPVEEQPIVDLASDKVELVESSTNGPPIETSNGMRGRRGTSKKRQAVAEAQESDQNSEATMAQDASAAGM